MGEIRIPEHAHAVRWAREGDWYVGELTADTEQGNVFKITARVSRPLVIEAAARLREQLRAQAPADVNVGAWADLRGAAQGDLHRYVLEEMFMGQVNDQVARRGWVDRPPWFGPWTADTVVRAYQLILAAQDRDPLAVVQLDRIRAGALDGNPTCVEALAKFDAVGRLIARGMSLEAVRATLGAGAELGALPGRRPAPPKPVRRVPTYSRPTAPYSRPTASTAFTMRPTASSPSGAPARPMLMASPLAAAALRPSAFLQPSAYPATPYPTGYPMGYPSGYPSGSPPMGGGGGGGDSGGGGGGGGGGDGLDDDAAPDDLADDGGAVDLDGGGDEFAAQLAAQAGAGRAEEEDEFPPFLPDDGSANMPPAPAPGENGEEVSQPTGAGIGGDDGGGVTMVPDLGGDDVYPDEGTPT